MTDVMNLSATSQAATAEYKDSLYALDTVEAKFQQPSIFESAYNIATKGVKLTGASILTSFANTAIDVNNFFGGDAKRVSMQDYGFDEETLRYYEGHAQGIEAAGLLVGSLVPGLAAIKALKLAQAGKAGFAMQRATNIFAGPQKSVINNALKEISGDAALYPGLTADKVKAIALGFGDQALQALAYETATLATMKASPLLDGDSFKDVVTNMTFGVLVGGGVGGIIEGIGVRATLNKALLNRDVLTKPGELATYLEKLDSSAYGAGDKVALLLDSIDKLPRADIDPLLAKKSRFTYDQAITNSRLILNSLVKEGDEQLTNGLLDFMLTQHARGMPKEEMYNYFARLAKVSRVNTPPSVPLGDTFYVNSFAKELEGAGDLSRLISSQAEDGAVSRAYRLRPYATAPKISRFDEMVELDNGQFINRYNNSSEAFAQGADIFLGTGARGKLTAYVNPKAPNIEQVAKAGESRPLSLKEERIYRETGKLPEGSNRPFYGAPLTLNLATGAVQDAATPVIGDLSQAIRKVDDGLLVGDRLFKQSLDAPISAETSNLDANSRYVWAAERGIQRGDTIASNDVAMLEQLRRELLASTTEKNISWEAAVEALMKRKQLSFTGEFQIPASAQELEAAIKLQKDNLIKQLIERNEAGLEKISVTDISRRVNVPEEYLENGFQSKSFDDLSIDPDKLKQVNHVQLEYNLDGVNTQQDGNIARGLIDVQYRIDVISKALDSQAASYFGATWTNFKATMKAVDANVGGAGAGLVSFANAGYNTLGQEMERIGKFVTQFQVKRMSEVSDTLVNSANALRNDPLAAAEAGGFIFARRSTNEAYKFLPADIAAAEGLSPNTAVLAKSLEIDPRTKVVTWNKDYVPEGFIRTSQKLDSLHVGTEFSQGKFGDAKQGLHTFYELSEKVAAFERANLTINNQRIKHRNGFYEASGISRQLEPDTLYAPPIDTRKYPYVALVRRTPGAGMASDDVAVMTASSAKELEQKIASIRSDGYEVYTKDQVAAYKKAQGDYDINRNFMQTEANSALARKGSLNNLTPDIQAENIVRDYVDWHSKQELRLTRDHVELANSQLFAELKAMGSRFVSSETSKTGFSFKDIGKTVTDPYGDYVKTALGVSRKEEYKLWDMANEKTEAYFSGAFNAIRNSFFGAKSGVISYQEASAVGAKYGLGNPYQAFTDSMKTYGDLAAMLPPERTLSKFVSAANSILATTVIRLDAFQSLINIVSTPVMLLAEANSAKALLTTALPDGSGRMIPATSKALYKAVNNFFDDNVKKVWMPIYKNAGIVREKTAEYFEMIDQLSLPYGRIAESEVLKRIEGAAEKAASLSGSNFSEEFARFVAADVGRQIFEAAGYSGMKLTDNISTFVNRVHGNYIASQRPVAFQGPIGQAIGLFQTYQFNLLQQVFRYVENKELKTIGTLMGMQATLFGMQGLPGFQAINNHIIGTAAGNPASKDIYSTLPSFTDKPLGDYLLYGVLSNWLNAGLYSRGDINPRQITILPTNPLDYPAISGGIRFIGNILDTAKQAATGGDVSATILRGLEHNGLSRPIAGLAQLVQGFSTTSQGLLIATTRTPEQNVNGWSDFVDASAVGRLLGARPLDEAIVMDAMFRHTLYKAKENERIKSLGERVRSHMYNGQSPSQEELTGFLQSYAGAGGNIQQFSQAAMKWSMDANTSVANQFYRQLKDPRNQQLQLMMGGQPLPDFANQLQQGPNLQGPDLSSPMQR
jgi:hypothetical protein